MNGETPFEKPLREKLMNLRGIATGGIYKRMNLGMRRESSNVRNSTGGMPVLR